MNMLKRVEPYVAWGYPNLKTVKELIYKRGYGKVSCRPCQLAMRAVSYWVCCAGLDGPHRQHAGQVTQLSAMAGGPDGNEASLPSTMWELSLSGQCWGGAAAVTMPSRAEQSAPLSVFYVLELHQDLHSCSAAAASCLPAFKLLLKSLAQGVPALSVIMLKAGHLSYSAWLPPVGQQEQDPPHRQLHHRVSAGQVQHHLY